MDINRALSHPVAKLIIPAYCLGLKRQAHGYGRITIRSRQYESHGRQRELVRYLNCSFEYVRRPSPLRQYHNKQSFSVHYIRDDGSRVKHTVAFDAQEGIIPLNITLRDKVDINIMNDPLAVYHGSIGQDICVLVINGEVRHVA
jgi:hypothetical protein